MLKAIQFQKHIKRGQKKPVIALLYCFRYMQTRPYQRPGISFTNSSLDKFILNPHADKKSQPSCSPAGQVSGRHVQPIHPSHGHWEFPSFGRKTTRSLLLKWNKVSRQDFFCWQQHYVGLTFLVIFNYSGSKPATSSITCSMFKPQDKLKTS